MSEDNGQQGSVQPPENPDISDLLTKLDTLKETVDSPTEKRKVEQTIALVERMPGSKAFTKRISKYTTRDIAQSFVGSIVFALPLLVEDGVFEIAEWFVNFTLFNVPIFLFLNIVFILVMTAGLLYYAEFRDVQITKPIFGFIPRRYLGVLLVSFCTATAMLLMWGRLVADDPSQAEQFGRITVIWAAAALGAALGDIIPGESGGTDINDII